MGPDDPVVDGTVITIPIENYNASRLASTIQDLVQQRYTDINYPDDEMTCTYDSARGTIKITAYKTRRPRCCTPSPPTIIQIYYRYCYCYYRY